MVRFTLPFLLLFTCNCSYPADADPRVGDELAFSLLATSPAAGAVDVARDAPLVLTFDTPADPTTANDGTVRMFSGYIELQGTFRTDLLSRQVTFRPAQLLRPDLRYQVYLDAGIRGLNGAALPERVVFDVTTGRSVTGSAPSAPPKVTATDLQPLFASRCASCHGGTANVEVGVDLTRPPRAVDTLVAVPALGRSMARVEEGRHAASYLMLKLLDRGGIDGFPMPADGTRLTAEQLRRVANWIDGGAAR